MSIIVSKKGQKAQKLDPAVIEGEDYLQAYIHANPESLPLDELKDNLRLLILAREFNTASGPIDALGVDADGEIYIIEAKLDRNADRRRIIAQALDYGAALWANPGELISRMDQTDWRTRLHEFLGSDDDAVAEHLAKVQRHAAEGRFWFVVLMDKLDDRLRELISFVNANSRFKVLGVELKFYRHQDFEILIPNLYGAERVGDAVSPSVSASAGKWNQTSFMDAAADQLKPESLEQMKTLLDWCNAHAAEIGWGNKGPKGGFNPKFAQLDPKKSAIQVNAAGVMYLCFKDHGDSGFSARFGAKILDAKICELPANYLAGYPRIHISVWGPRVHDFIRILEESLQQ